MTLTFEVTLEEARRIELARAQGIDVNAILRGLIASLPPVLSDTSLYETASEEEWEAAMDELALGGESLPVLPPEAFDRENIYEERF